MRWGLGWVDDGVRRGGQAVVIDIRQSDPELAASESDTAVWWGLADIARPPTGMRDRHVSRFAVRKHEGSTLPDLVSTTYTVHPAGAATAARASDILRSAARGYRRVIV